MQVIDLQGSGCGIVRTCSRSGGESAHEGLATELPLWSSSIAPNPLIQGRIWVANGRQRALHAVGPPSPPISSPVSSAAEPTSRRVKASPHSCTLHVLTGVPRATNSSLTQLSRPKWSRSGQLIVPRSTNSHKRATQHSPEVDVGEAPFD